MPADPNLPETAPWPGTGHISLFHATLHAIANRIYRLPTPVIRTASFTITQAMQSEILPVDNAGGITITVPALDVTKGSPTVEIVQLGVGPITFNFTGVTPLIPTGSLAQPRVQYSIVSLLWITGNTVLVGGDLA